MPFFPLGSAFRGGPAHLARHAAIVLVADKHGATPAQIALAWLLARYERMLLIPGTSSIVHLDENMAAIGLALDDADLAVPRSSPVMKAPASPAVSRALRSMTCASTVSRSFPLPVRRCLHPQPRRRVARPRRSGDAGAADRGRQADLIRSGRFVVGGVSQKQVRRRTVSGHCPLTYRVCGPAVPTRHGQVGGRSPCRRTRRPAPVPSEPARGAGRTGGSRPLRERAPGTDAHSRAHRSLDPWGS